MIRKPGQIIDPPVSSIAELVLPTNSLFHYIPDSKVDIGPQSDNPILRQVKRPVPVYQVLELVDPPSDPREVAFEASSVMRGYLERNRRFRKLTDMNKAPRDEKTLILANYSLIHNRYKYIRSQFADYLEWQDLAATVASRLNEFANLTSRNQFFMIGVPKILPSIGRLEAAEKGLDQTTVKFFNTPASRWLLELWKWLDIEQPEDPKLQSVFRRIEEKNLKFINLIIEDNGQWICFNLATIRTWLKSTHDEIAEKAKSNLVALKEGRSDALDPKLLKKPSSTAYSNKQMQKYLLAMYLNMMSARSVTSIDTNPATTSKQDKPKNTAKPVIRAFQNHDDAGDDVVPTDDDEDIGSDVAVKKAFPQDESTSSSPVSSKADSVKTSRELLEAASRVMAPAEDDSDSGDEINDDVNRRIDEDLAELEKLSEITMPSEETQRVQSAAEEIVKPLAVADVRTYEERIRDRCIEYSKSGMMTAAEFGRMTKLAEKYKTLPDPFDPSGKTKLVDAVVVTEKELEISHTNNVAPKAVVVDETMRYSNIEERDRKYINETLKKHMLASIMHVQNAGVILDNLEVEKTETILGTNQDYLVRIIPIEGAPTTWRFPIPEVSEDGTYMANGVKYTMRNQRGDYPIRKVDFNKVALTSYYGKFFVYRSRKAVNDYRLWITEEVNKRANDPENDRVLSAKNSDVFAMDVKAPRSISSLSKTFKEIVVKATTGEIFTFYLDLKKIYEHFNEKEVRSKVADGYIPIALSDKGRIIYYEGDAFYIFNGTKATALGEFEDIIGLKTEDAPVEFCELKIAGKYVPIGIILAHDYGLSELIKRLKINVRRVPVGTRVNAQPNEVALTFSDEVILFPKDNRMACLLLGGFLEFKRVIRGFSVGDFDQKGVYQAVLDTTGGGARVMREIRNARDMFVDPITLQVLRKLKQPEDFMSILVYAAELLKDDMHKHELDMSEMRIKGYERFAGTVYKEMTKAIRAHNARSGRSRFPIDLKPYAIWQELAQDPSIVVVKDINPIENLKQREEVTFSGAGGRSDATMTASTREYNRSDMGIISEATKDSGAVGINTYMPANPNLMNTLGMPVPEDEKKFNMNSMFSTAVMASPAATRDDMKRQGFVSIQHAHGLPVVSQMENIVKTGMESVIPHRTGEMFAVSATQNGKVLSVTDDGITIQYEDGTTKGYGLGRMFGDNAGMVIPHMLVTSLKEGQKFEKGDILTYNKNYFKPDTLNPKQVSWCNGTYAWIGLCEPADTLEDASVISSKLADMLRAEQTKMRTIVVSFNQAIHRVAKVGEELAYDDILCIIEDAITTGIDVYDEADIESLKALGSQAPKAKYSGVLERLEVYYRGEKEDMSESIRKLVDKSDREIAARRRSTGKKVVTGEVNEGFKIKGNVLPMNSIAIRMFITGPEPAGIGDKVVFVNQLKSIIGKVIKDPMTAEDGTEVLGRFSYTSVARRIVCSPEVVGTTAAILMKGAELAVAAYDS